MAFVEHKLYKNGSINTSVADVGYSASGGYQWATYKVENMAPADAINIKISYGVNSFDNKIGVTINNSPNYPGSGSSGKLTQPDFTFQPGRGVRWSSDSTSENPKPHWVFFWNDSSVSRTVTKKFEGGTYYIHLGYVGGGDSSGKYVALDIYNSSSSLTVSKNRTYTIQYNANNGSGAPSSSTKTHAQALTLSTVEPTRPGYKFESWNTASDGSGQSFDAGASFTIEADTTLYAQWSINTLTIKMNVNGGKKASESLSNMTISNSIALYNGKSQIIKYGESFHLWNYNNPSQINLRRPGYIISQGKEFCSTNDGTGITYDQARQYDITDFADVTYESKTITLYVNWKTGGLVYISDGSQWIPYQAYHSNGSSWDHVMPYISNGSEWIQYT